ncbi:Ger(x)C family spore germination protein [Clostridium vincentii]|uniref:Spore germination protein B3 n=1 Tax=Clostridium vincentii TaxID=52704 RepID=A0A2T0BGK4_9CLOT|nr:Ger(x)C family spore germination protein [Clostridium vincentii]PRR83036.1 Spore germination protein B3 precursor [Clostridium vincentii]
MKKRVASILLVVLLILPLGGCFNYTEINRITFATSIIFDKDDYDNIIVYLDSVRPYRDANESSDKGKRIMLTGTGKTALEAIRNINVSSSNVINFSQVRAYIFSEQVAKNGVKNHMDLINNHQEFGLDPYMFVYFGEIDDLLKTTNDEEEYLGLYLDQLVENNKHNGTVIKTNVNDYVTNSQNESSISLMSAIELKSEGIANKVELNGGVIMKDNHMVDKLEQKDALTYNILKNRVKGGTFQVANPNDASKLITLDILNGNNKSEILVQGEDILLKKKLNIKLSIGEIQGNLEMTQAALETIKVNEEWKLKKYEEEFFQRYKEKEIDILGVNRLIEEKYPSLNKEKILSKTILETEVNLIIDGSNLAIDSL